MPRSKKRQPYLPVIPPMQRLGWQIASDRESMTYYGQSFRLTVHLHIDEPGKWFISCHEVGVAKRRLDATSLEGAAREGLVYVSAVLRVHAATLEAAETTLEGVLRKGA